MGLADGQQAGRRADTDTDAAIYAGHVCAGAGAGISHRELQSTKCKELADQKRHKARENMAGKQAQKEGLVADIKQGDEQMYQLPT